MKGNQSPYGNAGPSHGPCVKYTATIPQRAAIKTEPVQVRGTVRVQGPVEVQGEVSVEEIWDVVDINLSEIVGRSLVESKKGMYIGVSSAEGRIIPTLHWGEVSIGN